MEEDLRKRMGIRAKSIEKEKEKEKEIRVKEWNDQGN